MYINISLQCWRKAGWEDVKVGSEIPKLDSKLCI